MNKNQSYRVRDTFNDRTVSSHRTVEAAVKAERKFSRAVKRANGANSWIPTRIEVRNDAGLWISADHDEVMASKFALDRQ